MRSDLSAHHQLSSITLRRAASQSLVHGSKYLTRNPRVSYYLYQVLFTKPVEGRWVANLSTKGQLARAAHRSGCEGGGEVCL